MADQKPTGDEKKNADPDLKDVEPGSDADASPAPEVGKTPPNPNRGKNDADVKE